jgi:predicted secreted protein
MQLSITSALAIYFVTWWIVLFIVLPWGVRVQREGEAAPGTDPGAPSSFRLGYTLLITTVVSGILFGVCYAAFAYGLISFDRLASFFPG